MSPGLVCSAHRRCAKQAGPGKRASERAGWVLLCENPWRTGPIGLPFAGPGPPALALTVPRPDRRRTREPRHLVESSGGKPDLVGSPPGHVTWAPKPAFQPIGDEGECGIGRKADDPDLDGIDRGRPRLRNDRAHHHQCADRGERSRRGG